MSAESISDRRGDRIAAVTGASGFIGRALCHRLHTEGWWVRGVSRRTTSHRDWDEGFVIDLGRDAVPPDLLTGAETLFHVAGRAHSIAGGERDWESYRRDNLESTRSLIAAAEDAGVRAMVYFSSVKAECATGEPGATVTDPYAESKWHAERAMLAPHRIPHAVVLRPALVYGPQPRGYLGLMIRAVRAGWMPPLPETGNARSMVHLDDLIAAALLGARDSRANRRVYVVTDGHPYSTREIYETILAALGRRPPRWNMPLAPLRVAARAGDLARGVTGRRMPFDSELLDKVLGSALYDGTAIEQELGFRAQLRLADAIAEMVATTD